MPAAVSSFAWLRPASLEHVRTRSREPKPQERKGTASIQSAVAWSPHPASLKLPPLLSSRTHGWPTTSKEKCFPTAATSVFKTPMKSIPTLDLSAAGNQRVAHRSTQKEMLSSDQTHTSNNRWVSPPIGTKKWPLASSPQNASLILETSGRRGVTEVAPLSLCGWLI